MAALIGRNTLERASAWLDTFPVLTIEGARQVGKSTFATMLAADRRAAVYTLDDPGTLRAARDDPQSFVEQIPDGTLVIDEIQRAPELVLPIKAAVDSNRRPGRFLLTGSSDLMRLERTPDSLAGRAVTLPLRPLSQGEIAGRREDFVSWFLRGGDNPWNVTTSVERADYIALLEAGGFPEAYRFDDRARRTWLDAYVSRITQRDTIDIDRPVDPSRLQAVLRLVAANQAGLVKARLARDADIPATSITRYLDVLEILFLTETLPPWTANLTSREVGRHKLAVMDSALAMRLARMPGRALAPVVGSEYLGLLLEGLVVSELRKQAGWSAVDFDIYHYRDRDGYEVDLVVELDDGQVLGIEVKATQSAKQSHFRGLAHLASKLGDRFAGGVVLNTARQGASFGPSLRSLPIAALWEA